MSTARFDLAGLYRAISDRRQRDGLSWAALAQSVGVAASTIRRFSTAADAEADGALALVRWLAVAPETFLTAESTGEHQVLPEGDGIVRVDMNLVADAMADPGGAAGRTRTTIQRLVAAAQQSGQSVASLTQISAR